MRISTDGAPACIGDPKTIPPLRFLTARPRCPRALPRPAAPAVVGLGAAAPPAANAYAARARRPQGGRPSPWDGALGGKIFPRGL